MNGHAPGCSVCELCGVGICRHLGLDLELGKCWIDVRPTAGCQMQSATHAPTSRGQQLGDSHGESRVELKPDLGGIRGEG
jgi:hypothetical protein